MHKKYLFRDFCVFCGCVILSSLILSCSKQKKEINDSNLPDSARNTATLEAGGVQFKVQYEKPRQVYKIDNVDLNNDGVEEVIVLSVVKDEPNPKYLDYYNFDMIQVFSLDSVNKSYVKILSDTVDYSVSAEYVDMNGDSTKLIIIKTYTGGNDVIISSGMFVYEMSGNNINLLQYFDAGNPQVLDINNDRKREILVTSSYWGVMTSFDNVTYIGDIFIRQKGRLARKNADFPEFFDKKIDSAKAEYYKKKAAVQNGQKLKLSEYPLYKEAVIILVNYVSKMDIEGLRKFWDEEKQFLKNKLAEDQYVDIENYVNHFIPSA